MRYLAFLLLASLLGCSHTNTKVSQEDEEHFTDYHHIGIPAFKDIKGQGGVIADNLSKALQAQMLTEPIDRATLEAVLLKYKVSSDNDLGVEALEQIRVHTNVDAIIFGRMAPDWTSARIIMVDARMGVPIFSALLVPMGKKKRPFTTPDDVVQEILRTIAALH